MSGRSSVRILALATNPQTGASTRFRVLQWAPLLEAEGFTLSLDSFFSLDGAAVLYQRGRVVAKAAHVVAGAVRRWRTLARSPQTADALLIHREAFPLGCRALLKALERFPGPIIYDYDDAMFLPQRLERGVVGRLEDLEAPNAIMRLSRLVLAGNQFLAEYARRYSRRVVLLPTCIDTGRFVPWDGPRESRGRLVVGWIGSHTTAKYLHSLRRVLEAVARDVPFRLYVVGSPQAPTVSGVEMERATWSLDREVEDFSRCDVGIYPLWNDAWAQGKCAFKAIQFMACGVPVVAAAVGANRDVVQDGVNGYLASTEEEWVEKLKRLLIDPELRQRFGHAGRQTVERDYSLTAHAGTLVGALRTAVNGHRADRVVAAHAVATGLQQAVAAPVRER